MVYGIWYDIVVMDMITFVAAMFPIYALLPCSLLAFVFKINTGACYCCICFKDILYNSNYYIFKYDIFKYFYHHYLNHK